jgi:Right handed beta helix region
MFAATFTLLIASLPFLPASAQSTALSQGQIGNGGGLTTPRVIQVGPNRALTGIAQAALAAKSGDVVEVDAGEYAGGVATWPQSNLTLRAVGGRARITQKGKAAEGKAIWVIKGDNVLIENFEFSGARVPGRNGAGIRHEGGKLSVRNCLFERNEMGLLTWNSQGAELVVDQSEFRDNAVAVPYERGGPIGHQIYVGSVAKFTLRDSYVHDGSFGHLVKSRARENRVFNNRITDENSGRASYELEFPNGGIAYVIGNIIGQSALTENADIVSFGAEGYRWPRNELYLVNNTLIDDLPYGGTFLRVYAGSHEVRVINNIFLGRGKLDTETSWKVAGNGRAKPSDVPLAGEADYRLAYNSPLVGTAADPGTVNGVSLLMVREYVRPLQSHALSGPMSSPGALQTVLR